MKFVFVKLILGFFGFMSLFLLIFSLVSLVNSIYFTEENLSEYLFTNALNCEDENSLQASLCLKITSIYWMFFFSIFSLVMTFITLFPFFLMKKK